MPLESTLRELEQLEADHPHPLERNLINTAVWFHRNAPRIPRDNLKKRCDLYEKAIDLLIDLNAQLVQRMQGVEGRPRNSKIWLPNGMNVSGDTRLSDRKYD